MFMRLFHKDIRTMPRARQERTYIILILRRTGIGIPECDRFTRFVEKVAKNGRTLLGFEKTNDGQKCEVKLKVRCFSYGRSGPHRLTRSVELEFDDVTVVNVMRE